MRNQAAIVRITVGSSHVELKLTTDDLQRPPAVLHERFLSPAISTLFRHVEWNKEKAAMQQAEHARSIAPDEGAE